MEDSSRLAETKLLAAVDKENQKHMCVSLSKDSPQCDV